MKKDQLVTVHVFDANGNIIKVRFPLDKKTYEVIKTQDEDHQLLYFSLHYREYKKEQWYQRRTSPFIEDVEDGEDDSFLIADSHLTPDEFITAQERLEAIYGCISKLREKQITVVVGVFFYGRTNVELAQELGVSKAAIGQTLRRALVKLKELLGDDFLDKF